MLSTVGSRARGLVRLALIVALSGSLPLVAQRAPTAALHATRSVNRSPSDSAWLRSTQWDSLTSGQHDGIRALWAGGGGLIGLAMGGTAGLLIAARDHRPSDQRELDAVVVVGLAAVGETIGVAVGAAAPGGRGRGACRSDARVLRSVLGTVAGTAAVALFASRSQSAYLLLPAGQIGGAVLALGGC